MMSLILTIGFIMLMFLRVPVSMAIGLSTLVPLLLLDRNLIVIPQFMLEGMNSAALLAVPFFILAGNLFNVLGLSRRIWDFAQALVGHLRGGLGHVMVISNMIFAGISGSALADAAGLGVIGIPAIDLWRHRTGVDRPAVSGRCRSRLCHRLCHDGRCLFSRGDGPRGRAFGAA
jgi:TRAP-type mannitol/chloroaromatic compound transport system permease large subunit